MKTAKKIKSFVLAVCCLMGLMVPLSAAAETVPRVVFENAAENSPDLYVTKHVDSAVEGIQVPQGLKFFFTLKLNGELANRLAYRVFDEQNEEVFNMIGGVKVPFQTDRSGGFSLEPEQTAKFEYVGNGVSYEVTETPRPQFEQIQPAGGAPAAGTVTSEGAWARFTNLYVPDIPGGKTTRLVINKSISFPESYDPPVTPDFSFVLKLDGKPYSDEPYTITDTKEGTVLGTGITDHEGRFTLKGGCTAAFEEVLTDVEYEVTEEETEGWWATGTTSVAGATTSPVTLVNFTNANASFAVTKSLEDNSKPEVNFTFLLTDADRTVWASAPYYLYSRGGELLDETLRETDEKGQFVLMPGQTAVFTGIKPGMLYNVSELGHPDYIQQVPATPEGYTDKVVTDAVEVLPFVNKPAERGRILNVTKVVENQEGEAPLAPGTFKFRLSKKEAEGTYQKVAEAIYSVEAGGAQMTYKTDEHGLFSIKANETARFTSLKSGDYKVEEIELSPEYSCEMLSQEGNLDQETLNFTFTNQYTSKLLDLYLVKKNRKEETLPGAEFMLYRDEMLTNPVNEVPYVSDGEGKITVKDLKAGVYYLVEKKSPEGYQLLANPVKIEMEITNRHIVATVDGVRYDTTDDSQPIYIKHQNTGNDEVHITVYNSKNFSLPLTGGAGNLLLILAAVLGIGIALLRFPRQTGKKTDGSPGKKQ